MPRTEPPAPRGDAGGQERFARFAEERVMPLLRQAAQAVSKAGCAATARLREADGRLVAQLEVVPPGLSAEARPPLLTITAARRGRRANAGWTQDRSLLVEYTGTFPNAGPGGGFGAEVDFDTINLGRLEEKVDAFVRLAAGA
jgi:hypothetical protein